jgi:hypothetical protein
VYNLFVSSDKRAWDRDEFVLEASRYLEHTEEVLRGRLASLDAAVVAELTGSPALFAY